MVDESVELCTIYLVDLVGSTALATSLGPARTDELRDEYFGLLRHAIGATGGHEFQNTGDGLMVAFRSASSAIECAVLTQQLFEQRFRAASTPLRVRIGLATGEATVKQGEYFGLPAATAARLCDKAPADGILVSPVTKMVAERIDATCFESAGELALKGIPDPLEAFRVLWKPLDPERQVGSISRWPLPERLRIAPQTAYVGRRRERGQIDAARGEARVGGRRITLLAGEPGIGKTRLASYSALAAAADGFAICWGACSEDLAVPYEPWVSVCRQLVEHLDEAVLTEHTERFGGDIGRLAGNLAQRLPEPPLPQSSDAETERFLLFKAVAELLRAAAGTAPLCVVLDDFHWADRQSIALLKHVAAAVEGVALHILVAYRDSDVDDRHPLTAALADLHRIEGVQRIRLAGLDAFEVSELLSAVAGRDLDADALELAGELTTEADGNPFFVGEILRSLIESGVIAFDDRDGRWRVDRSRAPGLPESVREVIVRRVRRLGPEVAETLAAGAVIGRSFELELVSRVVDGDGLLDQLEAAVDAALLQESAGQLGRFEFVHALINQTLYEGMSRTRRARMHHRIAVALEQLCGPDPGDRVGELALHWRTSGADRAKAARYASLAGQRALDSLAPAEAAKLFAEALDLLGPAEDVARCRALIGLGTALQLAGDAAYRETLLDASRIAGRLGNPELAAAAALANTRGFQSLIGDLDEERTAAIEQAVELDDGADVARRAQLLALQSQERLYEHEPAQRQELAKQAITLARGVDDARSRARILQHAFHGLWSPDMVGERAALTDELLDSALAAGDQALEFWACYLISHVSYETGDFARAQGVRDRQHELAEQLAQPTPIWVTRVGDAGWSSMHGPLDEADRLCKHAREAGYAAGQPDALQIYGEQRAMIRVYRGLGDERLIELAKQAAVAHPRMAIWPASQAHYEAHFGSPEVAAELLRNAAASRLEAVGWDTLRLATLAFYADAAARMRDRDAAAPVHELLQPWREQFAWGGASGYGHVRLWLGVTAATLGLDGEADEHFAFACRFHEDRGINLWAARAHLGWAEALAVRGETARAREHASRAVGLSRAYGYGLIEALASPLENGTLALTGERRAT